MCLKYFRLPISVCQNQRKFTLEEMVEQCRGNRRQSDGEIRAIDFIIGRLD